MPYPPKVIAPSSALAAALLLLMFSTESKAIPAFSRQYGTSCTTCHVNFPKLNDFGKAFKDAGFKFPKDDETFVKALLQEKHVLVVHGSGFGQRAGTQHFRIVYLPEEKVLTQAYAGISDFIAARYK